MAQYGSAGQAGGKGGPLASAWADFKSSPGKLSIILKLALFQFVPGVGGLVITGYIYTWAKEQALGRHDPVPRKIIRPGVLDTGLYTYGVWLITAALILAVLLISASVFDALRLQIVFAAIIIVGIALVPAFSQVMFMRAAICGRVRSGMNLKRSWDLFTAPGKLGSVLACCWVPMAAAMALSLAVAAVFGALLYLIGLYAGAPLLDLAGISDPDTAARSIIWYAPLMLAACFALFSIAAAASIISARAFGYWMQEFAPAIWDEYRRNAKYYADNAV